MVERWLKYSYSMKATWTAFPETNKIAGPRQTLIPLTGGLFSKYCTQLILGRSWLAFYEGTHGRLGGMVSPLKYSLF